MTKILITGACGFIGINLVDYLLEQTNDLQIVMLDRLDISVHPSRLDHLRNNPRVNFVWWDLRAELNGQVKQQIGGISYIVHLAASSHVNRSIQDPRLFLDDNVVGTMNILNYARSLPNLRRFYHQSTDEVMGPSIDRPFTEDDAMNPTNPYSASKASAESIVISFANTYSIPSVIARCVNVYGKYQNVEKFIPLIIKNLYTGKVTKIHCRNSIPGTRYYIHTTHLNEAILYLLFNHELPILTANNRTQGTYNLTTGYSRSNLDLFALIKDHMRISGEFDLVEIDKDRPNHDLNYHLDGTKLSKLGFNYSKLDFSESIKDIVIWYLNNKHYLNL